MYDRRTLLKSAFAGAVLLGSRSRFALAEGSRFTNAANHQDRLTGHVKPAVSRVIVARDPNLHGPSGELCERRVIELLDRAMAAYTGREKPLDAWKHVVPRVARDKVIGLKINGKGGKGMATHAALVLAITERLQQAGVKPGNILVWDRDAEGIEACGLTVNANTSSVRCVGSDLFGYEEQSVAAEPITYGAAAKARLSKILTRTCDMVIGLPILKDHSTVGLSFAMENMNGVVEDPRELYGSGGNPGMADLNLVPAIRQKVCFTIGDAITSLYEGGPEFNAGYLWQPNALIVAEDRVAADLTAWQLIDGRRVQAGLLTLQDAGRAPLYIATAADSTHNLGFNDPRHIDLIEI